LKFQHNTYRRTKIVFIGGATIPLYLDEVSAADARPTTDVDCVVDITPRSKYYRLEEKLRQIGLEQDKGKMGASTFGG